MDFKYNFSGYVTKNDITCSDGRVIKHAAFKHQDGAEVALVWNHGHDDVKNILGKVLLEHREDGVYGYASFNGTEAGKHAADMVKHGGIKAMSIFANNLKQTGMDVLHGMIQEVSLVLSGANAGALIDFIQHGETGAYDSAKIFQDLGIDTKDGTVTLEHAGGGSTEKSVQEVYNAMDEEQKDACAAIVAKAMLEHKDQNGTIITSLQGGEEMKHNVFDNKDDVLGGKGGAAKKSLTHDEIKTIMQMAGRGGSLKNSFLQHADGYGITDIEILFPDFKALMQTPDIISRRMEWVSEVFPKATHKPFTRLKTFAADLTEKEARAKGYIKGDEKKEEVFKLLKRETSATMIYKKQKLDREDILEITDLDIIAFMKAEMRIMLDEEISRAILIGDGREIDEEGKINEEKIRPIYTDDDLYSVKVELTKGGDAQLHIEEMIKAKKLYKGSGAPTMFSYSDYSTDLLLSKDANERRFYKSMTEVASDIRVSKIVDVEVMENVTRVVEGKTFALRGIMVNMKDYAVGAKAGGKVDMFEDFDIDFNQQKYLIETYMSGALIHPFSALVFEEDITAG